ncbi:MAG: iron-sulfur cluster assembly scaffold protein [Desulfonauticus sp.]|nr:iron-sulfur cluster assembly scaffold protein [Desulfonauticus sp.]
MRDLENFCNNLQNKIYQQTAQEFGQEFVKRWINPQFVGKLESYTHRAKVKPSCGSVLEFYLHVEQSKITDISFYTDGCGSDFVCAEVACELVKNKDIDWALNLTPQDILAVIPKLPLEKHGALYPPVKAIKQALT